MHRVPMRKPAAPRRAWNPQRFGKNRAPERKPAAPYLKRAPVVHMVELTSTTTFAANCVCSGMLLFAYTVFVFRRLAEFRRTCLPDLRAYQPLPRFGTALGSARRSGI